MSRIDRSRIEGGIRIVLGLVFLGSGVIKILDPSAFAYALARLRLLPAGTLGPVAILLPWIEGVAGVALLGFPSYRDAALRLLVSLLGVFTLGLLAALARGASGSCGCFGSEGGFLGRADIAVARNLILLALAGALLLRRRPRTPEAPPA